MRSKFQTWFRGLLVMLLITAAFNLWAASQTTNTNSNTAAAIEARTNPPSSTATNELQKLEQRYLTFGLDRLPALRDIHFIGEPLWKYIASFIYIFLAFYI